MPRIALRHVSSLLSPEQLTFCVEDCPEEIIEEFAHLLTPEHIAFFVDDHPWETLLFAADRLSSEQLVSCASKCGPKLNKYLRTDENPSSTLVKALFSVRDHLSRATSKAVTTAIAKLI